MNGAESTLSNSSPAPVSGSSSSAAGERSSRIGKISSGVISFSMRCSSALAPLYLRPGSIEEVVAEAVDAGDDPLRLLVTPVGEPPEFVSTT